MATKQSNSKDEKIAKTKKVNKGLIIALSIVAAVAVGFGTLYGISMSTANQYAMQLESAYQKSFYNLMDNVNNLEVKLSKVIASNNDAYTKKMLSEVCKNASMASENISALPISINGLSKTTTFINQVDGYSTSLCQKLENGGSLTSEEKQNLSGIYDSVVKVKQNLNKMSNNFLEGYSIVDSSQKEDGDYNDFTTNISSGNADVEYPTMIYDGPFADSITNAKVKGLEQSEVDQQTAKTNLTKAMENVRESQIEFLGETKGRFNTYDFSVTTTTDQQLFVQVTKKGGNILNISGYSNNMSTSKSLESAISVAKDFANKCGVKNTECSWSDVVGGFAFVNLTPKQNNTLIYPDLVKVKIDLSTGYVLGYDATEYYTNHIQRNISSPKVDAVDARQKISADFTVQHQKLALCPLDWNREVLCYEFKCTKLGATYYIYINAENGNEENILKVVETNNGNLLM